MITIFDWLGDLIGGIGDAIGSVFSFLGEQISNVIWDTMLQWFYTTIYDAVAQFFTMMGNMGAEIFDLDWVKATVELFTLFGWALFVAGVVVAVFDVAIEYQHGRADIKSAAINVLKAERGIPGAERSSGKCVDAHYFSAPGGCGASRFQYRCSVEGYAPDADTGPG